MGAILSLNSSRTSCESFKGSQFSKRQRIMSSYQEQKRLIPYLPDEISLQILARVPRVHYWELKLVSLRWKEAITSPELYDWRSELGTTEEWLFVLSRVEERLLWHALDPVSQKWQKMPLMPSDSIDDGSQKGLFILRMCNMLGSRLKIINVLRGWLRKGNAVDTMPFCGCSIGAVDGCLYVMGGLSRASALRCVWRYDPIRNSWSEVCPMSTGRAYSKCGVVNNKLYVVGGVNKGQGGLTPLQSAEVFDPQTGLWSEVPSMPFSKIQVLPNAFLADLLKPIATGLTTYRGKLYVPQSLYCWPFFVDAGGEIYDPETNSWFEMPNGMGEGWPAKQAGTKVSAVVNDELYALDPSSSMDSAKLRVYDHQDDLWKVVPGEVPIHDHADAESPYLLSGFRGKLHVITKDANHDIAVLQAVTRNHFSPSPSNSLSSVTSKQSVALGDSGSDIWRVIATRRAGSAELVSCQILDI
ncbi:hypothetical protein Nepgr_004954 [Nepenthes gracilis]|uniref:F-box domain-containing protein n=1 Tax=Nepenthes gracilis TaxID=150966 RepID=A0AAD3S2B2_NEPGR|nr:hypothetical protein Nepgr_004954 [Nepenthes gracilis]